MKKKTNQQILCSFTFLSIDLRKKKLFFGCFTNCVFIWLSANGFFFAALRLLVYSFIRPFISSICVLNKMLASEQQTQHKKNWMENFHLFNAGHILNVLYWFVIGNS